MIRTSRPAAIFRASTSIKPVAGKDFGYSEKSRDLQRRVAAFMDEHIYPNEATFHHQVADYSLAERSQAVAWASPLPA